jgi:hypothetical protein
MSLFVVKHEHNEETCPARVPEMARMLVQHVSAPNVEAQGMRLHGEGVIDGGHTLYMILDSPDRDRVEQFMAPFAQAGTVEVMPASTCEVVAERAGC